MSSFSRNSIALNKVFEYAQEDFTFCVGHAKTLIQIEQDLLKKIEASSELNCLILGFDAANTHLHGVLVEDEEIVDLLQTKLGFQVDLLELCQLGAKRILVFFLSKKVQQGLPLGSENDDACIEDQPVLERFVSKQPQEISDSECFFSKQAPQSDLNQKDDESLEEKQRALANVFNSQNAGQPIFAEEELLDVSAQNKIVQQTLTHQFEEYQQLLNKELKVALNTRQKKAITYLKNHKKLTNRKFRDLFNVSHKTAHIELTELVEKGVFQRVGSGRSTRYIAS